MKRITTLTALALLCAVGLTVMANAHGGGLNKDGCHNNRKTGDYHCHRAPQKKAEPVQSPARPSKAQDRKEYYANCGAARAAGAAPVRRGEPGYGRHLDRDNDGIGCE